MNILARLEYSWTHGRRQDTGFTKVKTSASGGFCVFAYPGCMSLLISRPGEQHLGPTPTLWEKAYRRAQTLVPFGDAVCSAHNSELKAMGFKR